MALPYRVQRGIVGIRQESTAGTFLIPLYTACFHARNISVKPSQATHERNVTRSHFGLLDDIPGASEIEIGFEIDLMAGASLGAIPYWDLAMIASGHKRVQAGGASITYTPTTDFSGTGTTTLLPAEGYSLIVWEEGGNFGGSNVPSFRLTGGQGLVSISTSQGQPAVAKFSFKGAYEAPLMGVIATGSVTDPTVNPPAFLGAVIDVHGMTQSNLSFDGFDFDKGNVLSKRASSGATNGLKSYWITGHKPSFKISPELISLTTKDYFSIWKAGGTGNFSVQWGTVGTNRFTFTAPRTQVKEIGVGEREGARIVDLTFNVTTTGTGADGSDYSIVID